MPLRFVWVRHSTKKSLEEVKRILEQFKPQVVGLELSKSSFEKLEQYKKRGKSELYYGYQFSKLNGAELLFLDSEKIINEAIQKLRITKIFQLIFLFLMSNLIRLFTGKRLQKLQVRNSPILKHYILEKRNQEFIKGIRNAKDKYPKKRILFIFGRAHKQGIMKGLESSYNHA